MKRTFVVWAIDDICREIPWKDNLLFVALFDDLTKAKTYADLLDDLDERRRNTSKNPEWGYYFFVQEMNCVCYVPTKECDEIDYEYDLELGFITCTKEECDDNIAWLQKTFKSKYQCVEIGPFSIDGRPRRTEKYLYRDGFVSCDEESDEEDVDDLMDRATAYRKEHQIKKIKKREHLSIKDAISNKKTKQASESLFTF